MATPPSTRMKAASMIDLDTPINQTPLVFLDVETTGLSPEHGDRVCEVAALRVEGDEVLDAMQQLINPQRRMGAGALAVHGITDDMLADAPPFSQIADRLQMLLADAVFVGHNAGFDLGFLRAEFIRARRPWPELLALDTLRLARACFQARSYSLSPLSQALGVQVRGRSHRAMIDVLLTQGVLGRVIETLSTHGLATLGDLLALQGDSVSAPEAREDETVPAVIRQAIREQRVLWIRYRAQSGEETARFVRPLAVRGLGDERVLLAYCLLKDAQRTFRLDRVLEMDLMAETE
jgi:DNA polymerase III subunit epsilon